MSKTAKKMITVAVRFDEEIYKKIKELAQSKRISIATLVRMIVVERILQDHKV
ncbi:MAG: DUF6290 family protein [Conexivisphaerales archaeon]